MPRFSATQLASTRRTNAERVSMRMPAAESTSSTSQSGSLTPIVFSMFHNVWHLSPFVKLELKVDRRIFDRVAHLLQPAHPLFFGQQAFFDRFVDLGGGEAFDFRGPLQVPHLQ